MGTVSHTLFDGTIITGFKDDHITNQIINRNNYYEIGMLEYIKGNISRGIMIDVGANIGNHALYLAKYKATEVIAFEPFPATYALLERNIIQNNLTNVKLMNLGLSNETKELFMSEVKDNAGMNKIDDNGKTLIKVVSFDSIWTKPSIDPITLIKIDCEGYEVKAVQGMLRAIKYYHPALFIECQTEKDLDIMKTLLKPYGYEVKYKFNSTPTYLWKSNLK